MKDKKKDDKKNGCFGCLGCLGVLLILALIFGACGAIFGNEEEPKPEEETAQEDQAAVDAKEEQKEQEEKEAAAKEKAEAEKQKKEEAERIAKEEAESEKVTDSDKDCGDFSSNQNLLDFWFANGFSADNDPMEIDRDNDGLPCEISQSEYDNFNGSNDSPEVSEPEEDAFSEEEQESESTPSVNISYENCTEVKEAGAAPISTDDPGYGDHLDRDGDGIACET